VAVEIFGPLDENQYVVDFIAVRDELKNLTDELDHRVLLPDRHPLIKVTADEKEVTAVFTPDGRRWIFPRGDCAILPVVNTTAELLAQYLAQRLRDALRQRLGFAPEKIRLAVDENHGQWGVCELSG
jgi:6-pyruvoyltetrahydropterin/6-carboxytetrahydropterin synthase